jgi:hypothetical protein
MPPAVGVAVGVGVGVGVGTGVPEGGGVGGGETVVVWVTVLLLVLLSGVVEETNAVFGIVLSPGALTLTTIVTEAKPGDVMVPRFATTLVPWRAHEPWLEGTDTKLLPPGSGSVTTTFSAALGRCC